MKNWGKKRLAYETIFSPGNAPTHKGAMAMRSLRDLKYEFLEHPPFSPDLAPLDFHQFPNLKTFLTG